MINHARRSPKGGFSFKSAQHCPKSGQSLPEGALLLDSLKTLESQLQSRGMVGLDGESPYSPLWFLAETERNIFLWRTGFSLIQEEEFEFWVDVPRLIRKRLGQLEGGSAENPFINPSWGMLQPEAAFISGEAEYLESLLQLFTAIQHHASALSQVASMVRKEITGEEQKPVILLPIETRTN